MAHGLGHGPVGALVSAWSALALAGSFELLMLLIRSGHQTAAGHDPGTASISAAPPQAPAAPTWSRRYGSAPGRHQPLRHREGIGIDRRKVKRIIDQVDGPQWR